MDVSQALTHFVLSQHVPIQEVLEGTDVPFITCFDEDGRDVSVDEVANVSPIENQHGREVFEPVPGVGHYAHLLRAGESVGLNGASVRYVFRAPDWSATVHVTEPSTGGIPDAVADPFHLTEGARRFAEGLATRS